MKEYLKEEIFNGNELNLILLLKKILFSINARFVFLIRLLFWLNLKNRKFLYGFISRYIITRYGCFIGRQSSIGIGVKFPHPNGIIVGDKTLIGRNCTIYQQVTFGGKIQGDARRANYPDVGDNVIIYAGAKLIGKIKVGDNSVIGANSVVNKDIPPFTVVGGVPAKILKNLSH